MKYALISVFNKNKICDLSLTLLRKGYKIISTGGTYNKLVNELSEFRDSILKVEEITGFPEILGGRVKTLQPLIQAGILADRENIQHLYEMKMFNVPDIDIVVSNLYPFSEVISKEHDYDDAIENIDIGGVTLIRAAAKNHKCISVFTDPLDYYLVEKIFDESSVKNIRKFLSKKAFEYVCLYDMKISEYFSEGKNIYRGYRTEMNLKYGANPHQNALVMSQIYPQIDFPFEILNGSAGYINYMDAVRAWDLVCEASCAMNGIEVAASFKHTTPAGVAINGSVDDVILEHLGMEDIKSGTAKALARARDSDPLSSFGDLVAVSHKVDLETALVLKREFSDGIIAPDYDEDALEVLSFKKSKKYLILKAKKNLFSKGTEIHEISNGVTLKQQRNDYLFTYKDFQNTVTSNKDIPESSIDDLLLANITLKYTPSNSIAISVGGRVVGIGAGQQNRVDCVRLAGRKAISWALRRNEKTKSIKFKSETKRQDKINTRTLFSQNNHSEIKDIVEGDIPEPITDQERQELLSKSYFCLASDAFFPFRDSIDVAYKCGIKYIAQPGGSLADNSVIDACNEYNICMVTTGKRVFLH